MINNPLNVPIRLRTVLDQQSARSAMRQLQDMLARGINISDTILGAANPNTHWRSRGAGYQSLAYMDRAIMGRGGMPGMIGRLGAGMFGFGGGVNSLPAMAVQAVETARNQEQAYSDLNRRVGESISTYARFREEVIATGREIGLTRQQIISLTDSYVSGVGKMNSAVMSKNLTGAMNLGKALGIDPQNIVGAITSTTRAGVTPLGGSTQPILAGIAAAIGMGGMGGRESEVVNAIEDLTQMLAGRLPTVTQQNFSTVGALMTVMNSTGNQGLMGSRGAGLIQGLDSWLQGKGGGATKNLLFMAMQQQRGREGKAPLDLLGLELSSEQGVGSSFNLKTIANMFGPGGMAPGGAMAPLLMKYLGITQTASQAQAFLPALKAVAGGAGGGFEAVSQFLGQSGINAAAMPYAVRALAGTENVQGVLADFASGMSGSEREAFQKQAQGLTDPQAAVQLLAKFGDKTDRLLTQQDKATNAMTNFSNSLIDLATKMLPAVTGSLYAMTGIVNILGGALGTLNSIVDMAAVTFAAVATVSGLQAGAMGIKGAAGLAGFLRPSQSAASAAAIKAGTAVPTVGLPGILAKMKGGGFSALRASGPLALAFAGLDAYTGISQGQDPMYAVGKALFTGAGSLLGGIGLGALGTMVAPGVGTVAGGIAGSMAGGAGADWLFNKVFGDGVSIKGDDKLAQNDTLKELLEFLKHQDAIARGLEQPTSFDNSTRAQDLWGPGSATRDARAAINATASSVFGRRVTQPYGHTAFDPNHTGVDLDYKIGEAFSLPFKTRVKAITGNGINADALGGNEMILEGPGGKEILLAHLKDFAAKVGDIIGPGQTIAHTGNTGTSSGQHLHFQVMNPGTGSWSSRSIDPIAYLNNINIDAAPLTVRVVNDSGRVTTYQTQLTATYKPSNR